MSTGDPSYSEPESALILQRAAELSAQQGRNLTLPELEAAAAEAGIDAALVRQAADEVTALAVAAPTAPAVPASGSGGFLGGPLHVVHERVLRGSLDAAGREHALGEIHRQLGQTGRVELRGHELCWSHPDGRQYRVTLTPRRGQTLVRVEERMGGLAGGLFLGMGLPVSLAGLGFILPICIVVLGMPVLIPLAFIAWIGLAMGLARTIFSSVVKQRDRQLKALADGLVDACAGTTTGPRED